MLWLSLISIGVWSGFFGRSRCCSPSRPRRSTRHKETALALVLFGGALVSAVLNPLSGAFSDRTVLRIGRRLPWVLGGLAGGVVACWCSPRRSDPGDGARLGLAQAALNAMLAAITATVPDQVPSNQRGAVGGWLAIAQTVGVVAGSGIAVRPAASRRATSPPPCVLVVPSLPYCLDSRDIPLAPEEREPFDLAASSGRSGSRRAAPRLRLGVDHPVPDEPRQRAGDPLPALLPQERDRLPDDEAETAYPAHRGYGLCTVLTAVVGGIWSDRIGRRKVFVIVSGLVAAAALQLLAFVRRGRRVRRRGGAGIGFGVYPRSTSR